MPQQLILKSASKSRPSGELNEDDYDVVTDGVVVGRIMKAAETLAFGHHEDRTPTHGYEATRERNGGIRQELATGGRASRFRT
jgi:hypothetical protein